MTLDTDDLFTPLTEANLGAAPRRKCVRHRWMRVLDAIEAAPGIVIGTQGTPTVVCSRCGATRNELNARRGRQSRNYGNRAELDVARRYGGTKVGHAGGPVDVRGAEFATQVKTHRRLPPLEWTKAFAGMAASAGVPRLLLRFVATGQPPNDYFVIPAKAWLEWFGKDEEAPR
jgi:hypothetical protein